MMRFVYPFLVLALLADASPRATSTPTTTTAARPTCTVTHTDGADDTPSIVAAIANCTNNSTILFERGVDYNTWTPAQFALGSDVDIQLLGNLHFSENITSVQKAVTGKNYKSGWFLVSGKNISLIGPGSTSTTGGGIYGYGQAWWDAVQQTSRPLLFAWKATNGTIKGVKIVKPIGKSFNLAGSGVLVEDVLIDAKSDTSAFPFNSDGFDVGGDGNIIQDSTIYNGDDCVAIGSPCMNLLIQRIKCVGSHGVSIAAKGGDVDVHNILVRDISMIDSLYGARYKSSGGGVGLAKNMVYENVYVQNVTFPIYITQNYYDQSQAAPAPSNTSVTIDGLSFSGFTGTINSRHPGDGSCISDPCWYYVADADGTQSIVFDTIYPGTVTGVHAKDIVVIPQVAKLPKVICNSTEVSGLDVGFKCWDGLYVPTLSGI